MCEYVPQIISCQERVSVPGHQSSLGSNRPHEALGAWQAFGVEFVLSFLLSSTVFATRDPHRSHLSAGSDAVVIGFAYLACTLAGLPATGASMNPARSLGPAFVMNKWVDHWNVNEPNFGFEMRSRSASFWRTVKELATLAERISGR
ncbi:hypothetical protein HPB51_013320 [Rhipicephalus microplus]|uniref:Uncharacterized protein n=1 Tax=Rhipicephalus microplus TaxID=6941 RepID=A0A9J6DGR3_RHIMP|nr:hypothetical protein HPB51_013320 [Rhipicephalus microplus]